MPGVAAFWNRSIVVLVAGSCLVGGCSSELSRENAARALEAAVIAQSPDYFEVYPVTAEVLEIVQLSDHLREARADVTFVYQGGTRSVEGATVMFARSDEGWTFRSFDEELAAAIAFAGLDILLGEYAVEMAFLTGAASAVRRGLQGGSRWDVSQQQITPILNSLNEQDIVDLATVAWGIQEGLDFRADVLWATPTEDPAKMCVVGVRNEALGPPPGFIWAEDVSTVQCRGGAVMWRGGAETLDNLVLNILREGRMFPQQ